MPMDDAGAVAVDVLAPAADDAAAASWTVTAVVRVPGAFRTTLTVPVAAGQVVDLTTLTPPDPAPIPSPIPIPQPPAWTTPVLRGGILTIGATDGNP